MKPYREFYTAQPVQTDVDSLEECLSTLSLNSDSAKLVTAIPTTEFILNTLDTCPICKIVYKRKGDLKNHLITQHLVNKEAIYFKCSCGVICDDQLKKQYGNITMMI